jgi:hypothetical protein
MIIKVTKNDNISSVHIDSIQNPLMLFSLLKTILEDNADIFSKPNIKKSEGEIEWSTDIDGEKISYSDADEETKQIIKGLLRKKVDKITRNRNEQQIDVVKKALEIPDKSDIFLIKREVDGKIESHVLLANWGHIKNSYNAERGVVFNIVGDINSLLTIEVLKDGSKLSNCKVTLSWDEEKIESFTDESGVVKEFVPIDTDVEIVLNCDSQEVVKNIKTLNPNEHKVIEIKTPSPSSSPDDKNKLWKLLLGLLILLSVLLSILYCIYSSCFPNFSSSGGNEPPSNFAKNEPPSKKITIDAVWDDKKVDFDLHLIDSCGNIIDNLHRSSTCKDKKVEFIKQSQGFDCDNGSCRESISAPDGLDGKVKIVINKFSSVSSSKSKVKLIIKRGDEVVLSREFDIKTLHPMLERVEPNHSDVQFEWNG